MYPQYDPYDGSEELSYENEWVGEQEQIIEGADCFSPFAFLNPTENLVVLKLTEQEWTELLSSAWWGAMFAYPEKYLQIVTNLLKGIHCPPVLEEQDCYEYPTYAGFFRYSPMNPYIQPGEIPDGYETQPFLVNGENGNNIPNYEHFDVIVPSGAITLDLDWFDTIAGQLPTIEVMVQGEGKAFIKMLTLAGGGLAVITVDNPPDLVDIIAGIVTSADNIIDLNQDLVSLPPETAQELIFTLDIVGTGLHTIYIVFLPILDDSLIPIRFGGGFRGVQLCDFVETPEMGITALRFENCNLEQQLDGEWTVVSGWENWLDCVPSGGGGGGSNSTKAVIRTVNIPANVDTTSSSFQKVSSSEISHTFSKTKALIISQVLHRNTSAGGSSNLRVAVEGYYGETPSTQTLVGDSGAISTVASVFENLGTVDPQNIAIWHSTSGAGTSRISSASTIRYTILEFEDSSELFIEDIRIFGGQLQKKIGGAWIPVSDSFEAIISNLQGQINSLNGLVTVAQSTANAAQTTANGAVTMNNTQNTRLAAIETWQDNADIRFSTIDAINTNQQTRIEQLEDKVSVLSFGNVWAWFHDFEVNQFTYAVTGSGTYLPGVGFLSVSGDLRIDYTAETIQENQISHIQATIIYDNVVGTPIVRFSTNGTDYGVIAFRGEGVESKGWLRVPNMSVQQFLSIRFEGVNCDFILKEFRYLGRGDDVPFN